MADNRDLASLTGNCAADEVTYSGDTAVVQLMRPVMVTGAEGAKSVVEFVRAEDSASANGDYGITIWARRTATPANTSDTDGDYEALQISAGRLWTSATVTDLVPGTAATNLGKAEDAGHSTGDVGVMALGVRNDANAAFSGTDLDYTPLSTDSAGNQNVMARRGLVRVSVASGGLTIATTAYTAGDQLGTQFTFAGCARASGGTGTIVGVVVISAADITGAMDLVITDSSITLAADNAAYAISDADALKIVGLVQLAGSFDIGNNRIAQAWNLAIPYQCSGGTSLYGGLITRLGHTFFAAVTDLQVILYVELN